LPFAITKKGGMRIQENSFSLDTFKGSGEIKKMRNKRLILPKVINPIIQAMISARQ
jgi:acetyl-CoA carboxylase beta subunit